nr:hypothetical protein [uncultured Dyadobacter sp.]
MKKMIRRITALVAVIGMACNACTDHGPENPVVQIQTGELMVENSNQYRFNVSLQGLDENAVQEFGVVYSIMYYEAVKAYQEVPTTDWPRIVFSAKPSQANHTHLAAAPANGYFKMFYRAYAILKNTSVLYGSVREYKEDKSGRTVLESVGTPDLTKPYDCGLILLDQGSKMIKEYGVVYSYGVNGNKPANSLPTIADKATSFNYEKVKIPVGGSGMGFRLDKIPESSISEIYLRSYVKYTDDTIEYGRYVGHAKK